MIYYGKTLTGSGTKLAAGQYIFTPLLILNPYFDNFALS
jgi:hypothetical protein